jgi:hypothetical protein
MLEVVNTVANQETDDGANNNKKGHKQRVGPTIPHDSLAVCSKIVLFSIEVAFWDSIWAKVVAG